MDKGTEEMDDYLNKWWNELTTESKRLIWRNCPVELIIKNHSIEG